MLILSDIGHTLTINPRQEKLMRQRPISSTPPSFLTIKNINNNEKMDTKNSNGRNVPSGNMDDSIHREYTGEFIDGQIKHEQHYLERMYQESKIDDLCTLEELPEDHEI